MNNAGALKELVDRVEAGLQRRTGPDQEEATARLASHLSALGPGDLAPHRALAVRGLLMLGRERYRNGHFADFERALHSADRMSVGLPAADRIEVLLQLADYELIAFDFGAALGHVGEALAIARASGLRRHEARARTQLGMALQSAGLYRMADGHFAAALRLLEGQEEPRLRGNLWALRFPVAFLLDVYGDDAAEEAFRQSMACAGAAGPRYCDSMVVTARCNRASYLIQRGRLPEARRELACAAGLANISRNMTWMIAALRVIADIRERNDDASRAALEALIHGGSPPARVFIDETLGVLAATYAAMGEAERAGTTLARKSTERANAVWALLHTVRDDAPDGAQPGTPGQARAHMLERLAVIAELRDDETGHHSYRMARLARRLAEAAGISPDRVAALECAARLHDIGKIAVPDSVLLKEGPLDDVERHLMREHPAIGARILQAGTASVLAPAAAIVRHHHERWDGKGYPDGLAGEDIPYEARIAAVADVYDALTHTRPYRQPWSHEQAVAYIRGQRGQQFDPWTVDLFTSLMATAGRDWGAFNADLEGASADSQFRNALADLDGVLTEPV